jgi:hypothetical protein
VRLLACICRGWVRGACHEADAALRAKDAKLDYFHAPESAGAAEGAWQGEGEGGTGMERQGNTNTSIANFATNSVACARARNEPETPPPPCAPPNHRPLAHARYFHARTGHRQVRDKERLRKVSQLELAGKRGQPTLTTLTKSAPDPEIGLRSFHPDIGAQASPGSSELESSGGRDKAG